MAIERLFVGEGVKEAEVKRYLFKELKRAGLAGIVIQRTPLVTRIVVYCDRPALVIGRKGSNVREITRLIEQNYKIEKPEIEVKKVDNPNLEPNIVAYRIASALERGMNARKVGYKALQAVMRSGAKGVEIVLSGKLVGKGGRSRVLKMKAGYLKKCGRPSIEQVMHGSTIATCKPGIIGVEVSIVPRNVHFPDEISIIRPEDLKIEEEVVGEEEQKMPEKTSGEKIAANEKAEEKAGEKAEEKAKEMAEKGKTEKKTEKKEQKTKEKEAEKKEEKKSTKKAEKKSAKKGAEPVKGNAAEKKSVIKKERGSKKSVPKKPTVKKTTKITKTKTAKTTAKK